MLETNGPRWNFFAAELEDVLRGTGAKGLGVLYEKGRGVLDGRGEERRVHQEKVRRLIQSLLQPGKFPTLNMEEMENVIVLFELNEEQELRLKAAILATKVEEMLYNREMSAVGSLEAARLALPAILKALREVAARHGKPRQMPTKEGTMQPEEEIDDALEGALTLIDRATLALHLVRDVIPREERLERAREARDAYALALQQLAAFEQRLEATPAWEPVRAATQERLAYWRGECEAGLASANRRLENA